MRVVGREPILVLLSRSGVPARTAQIAAPLRESLLVVRRTGYREQSLERVVVDTTVQEKAIRHPTDTRLIRRAIEKLLDSTKREDVELRRSYLRLAKRAAMMVRRCIHAHQPGNPALENVLACCSTSGCSAFIRLWPGKA